MDIYSSFITTNSEMILPAIAAFSVILLILQKLYFYIRVKFPVRVNCWFCNCNTSVPYNSFNSWYCPHCDQYNGFNADGSYNRLLVEQFNPKFNCSSWCIQTPQKSVSSNGLCRFCNINLELKVQQLTQFVPLSEEHYDEEVEQYSNQLERVYRLCSQCQKVLKTTLIKKQDEYITKHQGFMAAHDKTKLQSQERKTHPVYLKLTALLSTSLLLSLLPYNWVDHLIMSYPLHNYINQPLMVVQQYLSGYAQLSILCLGVLVQLVDCVHMKNITSFVNLLLWSALLSFTQIPLEVDGLVSIVHMLASIVFLITSTVEYKNEQTISVSAEKPVQFQKLGGKPETKILGNTNSATPKETDTHMSSKSPISDPSSINSVPILSHEPTPEDFGFGKLNVSSRRVTRSQTKPFQTRQYGSVVTDLSKQKPVNLSPPKLQFDHSDYQIPLTRSSSQSSGFVSLSNQKDFEEHRSSSLIAEDIDSVSQCGAGALNRYQSRTISPIPFSNSYGMPFSHFPPYALVHFSPPPFSKFYQYSNMSSYEPSLNMSTFKMEGSMNGVGWFTHFKNGLYSLCILLLVVTNLVVLWKELGEEYFKLKT